MHELVHAIVPERSHVVGGLMAERMGRALLLGSGLPIDAATSAAVRATLAGRPRAEGALAALPDTPAGGAPGRP